MADAVEMIAAGAHQVGDIAERHIGEGVMSANGVPEQPEPHQAVGGIGKPEIPEGEDQQREDQDDWRHFGYPDLPGHRADGQGREENHKDQRQCRRKGFLDILAGSHAVCPESDFRAVCSMRAVLGKAPQTSSGTRADRTLSRGRHSSKARKISSMPPMA